ncbi:MAG: purine-nucleoside phosphorylase [Proteobacteria bacterium]|nr:MAG: purine-nucleoside phosphorylase [Pseudomonadota bacterium]
MSMPSLTAYREFLKQHSLPIPKLHVVLGSGFGSALETFPWEKVADLSFAKIPDFPPSTVQDHAGCYRFYRKGDEVICFQMGRLHGYEGHAASVVTRTVMLPRKAGVKNFLLTNASGGLGQGYHPGDVMVIRDQVNLTGQNPLTGPNPTGADGKELGPRFPDMANLYDSEWRARLKTLMAAQGLGVQEGTYLGIAGPSFETHAEVRLFASWGMHAVGMSTVWEAIALKHSGAKLAGLSLISNLGAGLAEGVTLDHNVILETCRASASRIVEGIRLFAEEGA